MRGIRTLPQLLTAAGLIAANKGLLAIGARTRVDGWRRAAGLVLRTEASTFVLSSFGLHAWSDAPGRTDTSIAATQVHIAERLLQFLRDDPLLRVIVRRSKDQDRVVVGNRANYTLRFEPWISSPARFVAPAQWTNETPNANADGTTDLPLMNFVCRTSADGRADLWARVNHVGTDGVPAQELMSRLESVWGTSEVSFPSQDEFTPHALPRSVPSRPDLIESQVFIDFAPLLAWRKRENAKLAAPMTISAAVLWWLGKHEYFKNVPIGTTVEVAAKDGIDRGVGIVVVRAADYFDMPDGLADFVKSFNTNLELTRTSQSASCKTLDAAAFVPATLATTALHHALENDPRAFGSMAVTILKDAKVFGAPVATVGHPYGFIAIGSVALLTSNGSKVGCIMAKGPRDIVSEYPRLLREAFAKCD